LPSWISQDDLKFYVDQFDKTGFRGGSIGTGISST